MRLFLAGAIVLLGAIAFAPTAVAQDASESDSSEFLPACATLHEDSNDDETDTSGDTVDKPEWQTLALTEVNSGEEFAIADLEGCVVILEPMATWCINCYQQLTNVAAAVEELDPDTFAVVVVSVEVGLENDMLASYSEQNDFDFYFVEATAEMLKAIDDEFGRSGLNPPATPHVYVAPDGSFSELHTGGESPEKIIAQVESLAGEEAE